ncbi:glycosyltransferase family 1 protein [Galbitalea sp. SE-J8]|uniref:glycosyltransferase family 4 protein n=1 Tax=Galbitalea sp. SE-J8 TaxID=3054952 RepID=UPI00259CF9AF|nr:glycosyltransferase family 1 protein [Galbitalea sp. SE-J8]MDM4762729.1 glycosyltransferase family 1 protein [Galbitalea sp. SE-J8]
MPTLSVIVDEMLSTAPSGVARYTEELARALIETAPAGCDVEALVAASSQSARALLAERLPGLAGIRSNRLDRRQLRGAWQHGFTRLTAGMVHAPSPFAPLSRHERASHAGGQQIVVTVHDTLAWTHPESLSAADASWARAMVARAARYADAVVVPTHAVADALAGVGSFGERIRVIGGAVSDRLVEPADAAARRAGLALPARYLVALGDLSAGKALDRTLDALAQLGDDALPLVLVGVSGAAIVAVQDAARDAGLPTGRVVPLGVLEDADYAAVIAGAVALVHPSVDEGFGLVVLEAMRLGVPVVHADTPAVLEVAGDAGLVVPASEGSRALADALAALTTDAVLADSLRVLGRDRAGLFSWARSAEKVWQLHADL